MPAAICPNGLWRPSRNSRRGGANQNLAALLRRRNPPPGQPCIPGLCPPGRKTRRSLIRRCENFFASGGAKLPTSKMLPRTSSCTTRRSTKSAAYVRFPLRISCVSDRNRRAQGGDVRPADSGSIETVSRGSARGRAPEKREKPVEETMRLLAEGRTLDEIAMIRGRRRSTIVSMVSDLVVRGMVNFNRRGWNGKAVGHRSGLREDRLGKIFAAERGLAAGIHVLMKFAWWSLYPQPKRKNRRGSGAVIGRWMSGAGIRRASGSGAASARHPEA